MNTQPNSPIRRVALILALLYPVGVLVCSAVNVWVKRRLGCQVDWGDELIKSAYGVPITLVSCLLLWLAAWYFSSLFIRSRD